MSKQVKFITEEQAYARMAWICSKKEYSPFDIEQKLYKINLSKDKISNIINQLKNNNYLSEERYIRSFIKDKLLINKWGRKKIEMHLFQKQLPKQIVDKVFLEYTDEELINSLKPILEKKWKTIKGESDYEKKGKLIRYALGRGFAMKDIISCMNKMNLGEIEYN